MNHTENISSAHTSYTVVYKLRYRLIGWYTVHGLRHLRYPGIPCYFVSHCWQPYTFGRNVQTACQSFRKSGGTTNCIKGSTSKRPSLLLVRNFSFFRSMRHTEEALSIVVSPWGSPSSLLLWSLPITLRSLSRAYFLLRG